MQPKQTWESTAGRNMTRELLQNWKRNPTIAKILCFLFYVKEVALMSSSGVFVSFGSATIGEGGEQLCPLVWTIWPAENRNLLFWSPNKQSLLDHQVRKHPEKHVCLACQRKIQPVLLWLHQHRKAKSLQNVNVSLWSSIDYGKKKSIKYMNKHK